MIVYLCPGLSEVIWMEIFGKLLFVSCCFVTWLSMEAGQCGEGPQGTSGVIVVP